MPPNQRIPEEWPDILRLLRRIVAGDARAAAPSLAGIDSALSRLEELRKREAEAAEALTEHRQRMNELRRLRESSDAYGGAIRVQRERLSLANWLRNLNRDVKDPLVALGDGDRDQLTLLCETLEGLETQLQSYPSMSETLDKEALRQRAAAEAVLARLTAIRAEIATLEQVSDEAHAAADRFHRIERFIGRLEHAIKLYDDADESSGLNQEISDLRARTIRALQRTVSEQDIERRVTNALNRIQGLTGQLVPQLDAEWPEAPVRLVIDDLMIKVIRDKRDDYLWEIGSGANWLAYHIALTVALQKFFLTEAHAPVPGLLVYDQPSQVYFPRRTVDRAVSDVVDWSDEDIVAVRKVFALLGKEALAANGRLQFIVLDHADDAVWGDLPGVVLAQRWRDRIALVPAEWLAR